MREILPWHRPAFAGWRIIRMHHYGIGSDRHLFVRMAHDNKKEVEVDAADNWALWDELERKVLNNEFR